MERYQKFLKNALLLILLLWTIPTFATIYENAEDNVISRWTIYDNIPSGATISNVYDVDRGSKVVKFEGAGTQNGYMLGSIGGWGNPNAWNNRVDKKIKWSMKYSEKYIIYISVQTQKGHRLLSYTNSDSNNGISFGTIHHGLGQSSSNGTWQTFTRDLEADLKEFESDNQITSVDAFLVRGSGYIDDVMSVGDVTPSVDTTKPVITLLGDENVTLAVGDTYTDAGATAMDDVDGDITANIQVTSDVNTSAEGNYTVTYSVSDTAGNVADVVTRKVIVEATSSDVGGTSFSVKGNSRLLGNYDTEYTANDISLSADGTKAYITTRYSGLQIVDISNPFSPTLLGSYDTSNAVGIKLSSDGTKAYIADGYSGLKILNISNPTSPTLLGSYNTSGFAKDVTLSDDGTKAYIADGNSGLQIIDISNATSPTLLGSYNTSSSARAVTLSDDGTKAYIADGHSGLQIIDISNATSPTLLSSYDTAGYAYDVKLSSDGAKAYIADGSSGLKIIDISNPTSPTLLGSYNTSGYASDVTLSDDGTKAYIADGSSGLKIVDISNPTSPILLKSYNSGDDVNGMTLSADGTMAYIVGSSGLQIVYLDFSTILGSYDTNGFASGVTLSDDGTKAYIADGYFGLKILNISNPSSPTLLSVYDVGDHPYDGVNDPSGGVWDVVLSSDGTKAYIANGYSGLKILDISNPASPTLLGNYNTPGRSVSIVLSSDETKAYIVNSRLESGLQIIDVSNPTSPTLLSSYDTASYTNDVKLSSDGTKAYIAEEGLVQIVDISNPTSPSLLGSYDTSGYAIGVTLSADGTKAYIADGYSGLQIVNISNPTSPTLLSSYDTSGSAFGVALSADGTKAYIADGTSGLQVVDISNPTSPTLLNSYDTSGSAFGVALSADGTKAYVADGYSGLQIIDLTTTTQYKQKDFGDTNIKLQITDNLSKNMTLSVTTDRDDIISVGSYDETLTFDEYNNQDILIPISSISGATGRTIITITLNNGTQTFTRKVYFNVYE